MDIASLNRGGKFGNWFQDPVFTEMRKLLEPLCVPLTVMELFGGLTTGYIALAALGCWPELKLYCDINSHLLHWISQVHNVSSAVHCGPISGDILLKDIATLVRAMIILAGPPCPPWSSKGVRAGWRDSRSVPFWRTLRIIVDQARSGSLFLFVLENVAGFASMQPDGTVPLHEVLQLLREELPSDWTVDHCMYNTKHFGLAQNRPRVYVVGRKTLGTASRAFPATAQCFNMKPKVSDFARVPLSGEMEEAANGYRGRGYSSLQKSNLRQWRNAMSSELKSQSLRGQCAFFAYDRTPSIRTSWKPNKSFDTCECLTANGPVLHCFSLGDNAKSRDSTVLPTERAALQGFPMDYIVNDHRSPEACVAIGNAMSVPVVATVFFRELSYQLQLRPERFSSFVASMPRNLCLSWKVYLHISFVRYCLYRVSRY